MSSTKRSILSEAASSTGSEKNSTSERSASRFLPASRAEMAVTVIFRPVREASAWLWRFNSRATAAPTVPTPATPTRKISLISFFRKSKQGAAARRDSSDGSALFQGEDQELARPGQVRGVAGIAGRGQGGGCFSIHVRSPLVQSAGRRAPTRESPMRASLLLLPLLMLSPAARRSVPLKRGRPL